LTLYTSLLSFLYHHTASTAIYTLSLHDALPISGRSHDLEDVRDFRIDGEVASQGEGTRELGPSMLHRHFPRRGVRITGMDQPRSIAIEDRQDDLEHVANHLLQVVRSLHGAVHPIHALEEPEMGVVLLFRASWFGHIPDRADPPELS